MFPKYGSFLYTFILFNKSLNHATAIMFGLTNKLTFSWVSMKKSVFAMSLIKKLASFSNLKNLRPTTTNIIIRVTFLELFNLWICTNKINLYRRCVVFFFSILVLVALSELASYWKVWAVELLITYLISHIKFHCYLLNDALVEWLRGRWKQSTGRMVEGAV